MPAPFAIRRAQGNEQLDFEGADFNLLDAGLRDARQHWLPNRSDYSSYPPVKSGELQNRRRGELAKKIVDAFVFMALVHLLVLSPRLSAQNQPEPGRLRFDLTTFMGYRTSMSFPVEPKVTGTNPRVVVDASPSYGASIGIRLREEEDLIEVRWARQDSYLHAEEITPQPPRQRMILDQFHGDFSHEPLVEDWPSWAKPFVLASVGVTHVSRITNFSLTRFSFGLGGGIRLYASRHLGFKIQAEWLPVFVDPQAAFICGGGCIVHVGGTAASQGEVLAGPILRF